MMRKTIAAVAAWLAALAIAPGARKSEVAGAW
jgi:hypothetical protein